MKKKTKRILLATGILVVLGAVITVTLIVADTVFRVFGIRDREIDSNPETEMMGKVITAFYKENSDKFWFSYIDMENKRLDVESYEKIVEINFDLKKGEFDDSVLENISEIYQKVMPSVKKYMADKYDFFSIEFYFIGRELYSGYYDGCIQIICMNNGETIKLSVLDGQEITLKAVADIFPELNQIEFSRQDFLQYDSIEDIAGFDDLQVVDFGVLLPEEEKEYILSIYPDCEIVEESYYKMKEK